MFCCSALESNPKRITLYRKTQSLSRLQLILITTRYDFTITQLDGTEGVRAISHLASISNA